MTTLLLCLFGNCAAGHVFGCQYARPLAMYCLPVGSMCNRPCLMAAGEYVVQMELRPWRGGERKAALDGLGTTEQILPQIVSKQRFDI